MNKAQNCKNAGIDHDAIEISENNTFEKNNKQYKPLCKICHKWLGQKEPNCSTYHELFPLTTSSFSPCLHRKVWAFENLFLLFVAA